MPFDIRYVAGWGHPMVPLSTHFPCQSIWMICSVSLEDSMRICNNKKEGKMAKKKDQEKIDHQTNQYYAVLKKADTALIMADAEIIRLKEENIHLKAENKLLKNKLKENFGIVLPDPPEKIQ
jgi:hypothetical protein